MALFTLSTTGRVFYDKVSDADTGPHDFVNVLAINISAIYTSNTAYACQAGIALIMPILAVCRFITQQRSTGYWSVISGA